jgi:hypothetical protein
MYRHAIFPIFTVAMIGLYAAPAEAQQVTFVSGNGNDSSAVCSFIAPCLSFAAAHDKTTANGTILCKDAFAFGGLTITKSITIDCAGAGGGTFLGAGIQVDVNGAGIVVTLRNMRITPAAGGIAAFGIQFQQGSMLQLHNVVVDRNTLAPATGILFQPNTGNSALLVTNSTITSHGVVPSTGGGIAIQPAIGGSARVTIENSKIQFNSNGIAANSNSGAITMTVRDSVISSNHTGIITAGANPINVMVERSTINNNITNGVFAASAASTIRLDSSKITGNGTGIATQAGGVIRSFGNNVIEGNGTNGAPTQTASLQ